MLTIIKKWINYEINIWYYYIASNINFIKKQICVVIKSNVITIEIVNTYNISTHYTMHINHFKYCKISNCYIFQKFNK